MPIRHLARALAGANGLLKLSGAALCRGIWRCPACRGCLKWPKCRARSSPSRSSALLWPLSCKVRNRRPFNVLIVFLPFQDINQIFDILPIMGVLEPGHTQERVARAVADVRPEFPSAGRHLHLLRHEEPEVWLPGRLSDRGGPRVAWLLHPLHVLLQHSR